MARIQITLSSSVPHSAHAVLHYRSLGTRAKRCETREHLLIDTVVGFD
jgi:hypothetical protein